MNKAQKIEGTSENWENGALGSDEKYARLATDLDANAMDEALGLQMISIRLQKGLIDDLKLIAQIHGLGYQPLIKQALRRFADCEIKRLLRETLDNKRVEDSEPDARQCA
jgi:hypothetical protein